MAKLMEFALLKQGNKNGVGLDYTILSHVKL